MTTKAGDAVLKAVRMLRLAMTGAGINPTTDMVVILRREQWMDLKQQITQGDGLTIDVTDCSNQFTIFGTTFAHD